jgi:hypothetical protein
MEDVFYIVRDDQGILIFNGNGFTIYQPELPMTLNQFLFNGRMFLSYGSASHFMRKYMSYLEGSRIVSQEELLLIIAERKLDGTL